MIFWILAAVIIVSALAVICLPNPLHSALCLATNLVAVGALYGMLGAHFLAAVQVTVYAGAIMVLVVFVIMLLNFKHETFSYADLSIFIVAFMSVAFCGVFIAKGFNGFFANRKLFISDENSLTAKQLGVELFTNHPLLFQLSGVLLLVALVGAVLLANQRRMPKVKTIGN